MKVVYKVILFWNQNADIPSDFITPGSHKNVVVQGDHINLPHVPVAVQEAIASLDVYKDTLRQKLSKQQDLKECNERFLKTVMRQVALGVGHLHKSGKLFGRLTQDEVYICCCSTDEVSVVLHNPSPDMHSNGNEEGKQSDIKGLAKFFSELLTTSETFNPELPGQESYLNCSDNGAACNLIKMMNAGSMSAQAVLDHPFFWADNEKIDFICESFDHVKHMKELRIKIDRHAADVFKKEWISLLALKKPEKTEIEKKLKEKANIGCKKTKTQVNIKTILNLATNENTRELVPHIYIKSDGLRKFNASDAKDWAELKNNITASLPEDVKQEYSDYEQIGPIILVKSQDPPYQRDSLFDLLRFFRNRRAHYWESKENARNCISPYPDGFWRFFSTRFPQLLPFVYENKDSCFHNSA